MTVRKTKVTPLWERLKRATVWHPINTDPTDDDRSGPRFWFPTYDMIAFALGISALFVGSPLLNRLFPSWFTSGMGVFLMIAAVMCFIGVVLPRYKLLELVGKLAIVFLLGGYAGTVAFRSTGGDNNSFVVLVLVMAVWLLGPRVTKLWIQIRREKPASKTRRLVDDYI